MNNNTLTFDAAAYAVQLTAFRSAAVAADGKADKVGSAGMAALLLGELSPLALAITFYDAFQPRDAKGKACEPKETDDGKVKVRNLEQPNLKGSAGARVALEAILYCYEQRDVSPETAKAVNAFARGEAFTVGEGKDRKGLTNLRAFIKAERLRIAKGEAGEASPKGEGETEETIEQAAKTDGERLAEALALLQSVTVGAVDASERLVLASIAAEVDRIAAIVAADADEMKQAA